MRAELAALVVFVFSKVEASPAPEDWVSGSPFSHYTADDNRADIFTSAYLNVSYQSEHGWVTDKTEVGRYGGGPLLPAYGRIVHVISSDENDHYGCTLPFGSSFGNKTLPTGGEPWIALVKRGHCNFEAKVENSFRSGAVGVLIYNDRDSATLDKMKLSNDNKRNISAVFIYKWKGEELGKLAKLYERIYVHISVAGQTTSRTASINRTSVLFVSITFIILMIISLAWLVFYYVQRFRYIHAKDRLSRRLGNAAKKALSKIPTKHIKSEDKELQGENECCAICIEPYKVNDTLRILPCSHEFHKTCIDPWLLEHRTCPMCKMDILRHYGFVHQFTIAGSQESMLNTEYDESPVRALRELANIRRAGGISPLPEIRAINITQQMLHEESGDEDSSRASSPNEMTATLSSYQAQLPFPMHINYLQKSEGVEASSTSRSCPILQEPEQDPSEPTISKSTQFK